MKEHIEGIVNSVRNELQGQAAKDAESRTLEQARTWAQKEPNLTQEQIASKLQRQGCPGELARKCAVLSGAKSAVGVKPAQEILAAAAAVPKLKTQSPIVIDEVGAFEVPVAKPASVNPESQKKVLIPAHWRAGSLKEILNRQYVEPRWLIEDLLLEQSGTQVSGHPHSTKSLNWLAAALESVSTGKVWSYFNAPSVNRVLYIETEDPLVVVEERVRQLSKGLGIDPKQPPEGFFLSRTGPFELANMETKLNALIDLYKPDWMVLSTLQGLLGGRNWNEQEDMGPVNAILVRIQQRCPLVVITHSTWDKKNKRAAGTITQAANFLTTMHFEKRIKDGETRTIVTLDSKMGFSVPEFDLILETETVSGKKRPELRRVRYSSHESTKAELIQEFLADNPNVTVKEVAEETGASEQYVRKFMKKPESKDVYKEPFPEI